MRVRVDVKPNSKAPGIEAVEDHLVVRVKEPPKEGKANEAVLRAVAEHYGVAQRDVRLVSGGSGRHKVIELPDR
ncbi:MAG: DUF167 domain-containing protein [Dehalococcoidia bacterium]|nr:MAG: DUF167 domain-containing protein [Dehalococcoidia bacterium]